MGLFCFCYNLPGRYSRSSARGFSSCGAGRSRSPGPLTGVSRSSCEGSNHRAFAGLTSVLRTCQKQGFDPVEVLKQLLQNAETMILDLAAPFQMKTASPLALAPPYNTR